MEKHTNNPENMSLLKNVYDTRKKKIRKKLRENRQCRRDHFDEDNNKNHHVLNNNSSNNTNVKVNKSKTETSEDLLGNLGKCNNDNRSCYIKRRKFPIMLFLLFYYYSCCYVCCSVSSFGVVVLANDEIDYLRISNISTSLSFDRTTGTSTTTPTLTTTSTPTHTAVRRTRDARHANLALNDEQDYEEDEEDEPDEDYDITRNKSGK